ncbi:MAG: GHKL domain-containing protein [Lachnospiraceae bacterium]|nr:GHKL domain-containing protein [Lachnospiraceae bacterium]
MFTPLQTAILYGSFLLGLVIMIIPAHICLRQSRYVLLLGFLSITVLSILLDILTGPYFSSTIIKLLFFIVSFLFSLYAFQLPWKKLLYLFLTSTTFLSFGRLVNSFIAAKLGQAEENEFSRVGTVFQYMFTLLIILVTILIRKRIRWFLDNHYYEKLWNYVWLIPTIITTTNLYAIPLDYSNIRRGRVFSSALLLEASLLLLYLFFLVLLYYNTYNVVRNLNLSSNLSLLESQINNQWERSEEYRKSQEILRRQRHDLRHQYAVLSYYLKQKEWDKMEAYLKELTDAVPESSLPAFCLNPCVNAICSYYASKANSSSINISIQIDVPEHSDNVIDSHLCIIFGNLLDNAIKACQQVSRNPFIKLRSKRDYDMLYITMDNSFNPLIPKAKQNKNSPEHGIGLFSVRSIAESHKGDAEFKEENGVFLSSVWLHI